MSNSCGFGQIKDGRFTEVCIKGSRVIDSKLNIKANKITARNITSRNLTLTNPCFPLLKTSEIREKNNGVGILLSGDILTDSDVDITGNLKITGNVSSKDIHLIATKTVESNTAVNIEPIFPNGHLMITSSPCNGIIENISGNGLVTYNSLPNFVGTDLYTYSINDLCGNKRCVTQLVCVQKPVIPPIANCFFLGIDFVGQKNCANVISGNPGLELPGAVEGSFPIDPESVTITNVFVPEDDGFGTTCANTAQFFNAFVDGNNEVCLIANVMTSCTVARPIEVTYTLSDIMGNPSNEAAVCYIFNT